MITSLFMQHSEILEMTGLQQPFAQKRWLDHRNWIYEVDVRGRPKISREFFNAKMSGKHTTSISQTIPTDYSVNVLALRKA